jgi:beta-phosphoglucomutase
MQSLNTFIFDVDGVLLDTHNFHYLAWKKLFDEIKVPYDIKINNAQTSGQPRNTAIKNILPEIKNDELDLLADKKQKYFLEILEKNRLDFLEGADKILTHLKKQGYKIAAASSSKNAPALLKKTGLEKYLDTIVSGYDFKNPKPDPEIFLLACTKLGSKPENSVVFEDASIGIEAAKSAGMTAIGITSSGDAEINKKADFVIKSLSEYKLFLNNYKL